MDLTVCGMMVVMGNCGCDVGWSNVGNEGMKLLTSGTQQAQSY